MKLSKNLWTILILGVILRLIVMGITYHPDLSGQFLTGYFFAYEGVTNIYDHLANLESTHPLVRNFGVSDIFIYPPLAYFTIGSFVKFASLFISENFFLDIMNGLSIYQPGLSWHLIVLKFPYILIDISVAFVLASLFDKEKQRKWALILWLFNPITFYATFSMGVFDIIPVLFTVLSLLFAKRKQVGWAAVMISLGIAYKQYPVFLLPFLVFSTKGFWNRAKIVFLGLVPYLLTIAPYLHSAAFKAMVFGAKSQKMFYMKWPLSGAEEIYPFLLGLVLLILHAYRSRSVLQNLWKYYLSFFIVIFSVTHYHPQWFLWISPFFIIEMVINKWRNLWLDLTIIACYVFIVLTFDNSLSVGMYAVLNQKLNSFPGIDKLIAAKTDLFFLKSSVRTVMAAVGLSLIFDLFNFRRRD